MDSKTFSRIINILETPHSVLSSDESSQEDKRNSIIIDELLKSESVSNNNIYFHYEVINKLKYLIKQWMSPHLKKSMIDIKTPKGYIFKSELFVFGSFMLETFTKDSDIDTVLIVPSIIERDDHFFGEFFNILKKENNVTDLVSITESTVPLIKMKFFGIKFDILFAKLNKLFLQESIEELIISGKIFDHVEEERSFFSLNGIRTCNLILKSVPNEKTFKKTLKYVKFWAKNQGLYSSLMGFLGGISWAILVAKICQLFPNYNAAKTLEKFFIVFNKWKWDRIPIKINDKDEISLNESLSKLTSSFKEANENYCINILTPSYPFKNCAYSVSTNSLQFIKKQLNAAVKILAEIKNGKKEWKNLFEKYDIFKSYELFLEISIFEIEILNQCPEKNNYEFAKMKGLLENKLRRFSKMIETNVISNYIDHHLSPIPIQIKNHKFKNYLNYYLGINIKSNVDKLSDNMKIIDLINIIKIFLETLDNNDFAPEEMNIKLKLIQNKNFKNKYSINYYDLPNPKSKAKKNIIKNLSENGGKNFLIKTLNFNKTWNHIYSNKNMLNDFSFMDDSPNIIFSSFKDINEIF